jgi:hypothetical protein
MVVTVLNVDTNAIVLWMLVLWILVLPPIVNVTGGSYWEGTI